MGLQTLVQHIWFNHLQTFFSMFPHMQRTLRCTMVLAFLPIRRGLAWRKRVLHLLCTDFQGRCNQFIRKKMCSFSFASYEGMWKSAWLPSCWEISTSTTKKVPPRHLCSAALLGAQNPTSFPWAVLVLHRE